MSLARIALRIAAVEALRGKTLVGDNVLDSPNGALDVQADGSLRTEEERPFVSVYTDDGTVEDVTGRSLVENGRVVLVIEAGISMAMTQLDEENGTSTIVGVQVPASDPSFEFYLDVVERQVADALNDPDSAWAEIYRGLHTRVVKVEKGGRRNTDDGQRLAGHQMRITLDLIDDPVRGEALPADAPFARFLAALNASDRSEHTAQAATLNTLLGAAEADWRVLQRRHGLTASELFTLGRGPIPQDIERATPELTASTAEIEGNEPVEITP